MTKLEGKTTNPTPPDYERHRAQSRAFAAMKRQAKVLEAKPQAVPAGGMATWDIPPTPPRMNRQQRRAQASKGRKT